ncbi:MAG: HD domain-containing protein [Clostridia bacterium]|nr:HD domain-containing protein [Clostridia bacterium]
MKKFERFRMSEKNPKWENAIFRRKRLYSPKFGTDTMRSEFDRDYTRIINCNAYKRLKGKTQVFFAPDNDHVCTRLEHVNLVESISYTIANALGLNSELTKAISVGHDLGHTPFGHQGEKILNDIAKKEGLEKFWHGRNGLDFVDNYELLKDYEGVKRNLSLTYAVRDGIIGHCGAFDSNGLKPREEYINLENDFTLPAKYMPYTWEACVVKIADNISYIGRDIEDALTQGVLRERDVEKLDKMIDEIKNINSTNIINYLVVDLCNNSNPDVGLRFSPQALDTMNKLIEFNNQKIYKHDILKPMIRYCTLFMNELFSLLKGAYDGENTIKNLRKMKKFYPELASEFIGWLANFSEIEERNSEQYKNRIVFDLSKEQDYAKAILTYLSGMTDKYIVKMYNSLIEIL